MEDVNNIEQSQPKRVQTSNVIDVCCSVARVRSACRGILNKKISEIKKDILDKTDDDGVVKWSSLTKNTRDVLENIAGSVKIKEDEKAPVPKTMDSKGLVALVRSKSFKVSQFANVSLTTAIDFVIQDIVRLAMITAKTNGKNNILPVHIVNDELKASDVFAMIYNLPIITTHAEFLKKLDEEQKQKRTDKLAANEAAKEQRKKDRENEKKKPVTKKKVTKKTAVEATDEKGEKKVVVGEKEVVAIVDEKKTADITESKGMKSPVSAKRQKNAETTKVAKKDSKKVVKLEKKVDKVEDGGEYLYYIDKIISVQKKALGDDYKGMRASSYFRQFCSNTISQLITRMANMFNIMAQLGGMKTITDNIVLTSINTILTDYRVAYPGLVDAVNKSVATYRQYRLTREKTTDTSKKDVTDE